MNNVLFANEWLELVQSGQWFFVRRPLGTRHVLVVAVDEKDRLVLVEQRREAVGKPVIELPAGMVPMHEDIVVAGRRELLEEAGYEAASATLVTSFVTSPGITDEHAHVVRARNIRFAGPGGGRADEGEATITTHLVSLSHLFSWLEQQRRQRDIHISATIYASLLVALDVSEHRRAW